jgi:hypothetical protein
LTMKLFLCTGDPYYVLHTALLISFCFEEGLLVGGGGGVIGT